MAGEAAGYATLLPGAEAGPFVGKGWPEITDFNVLRKFQRRGIGNRILDTAEQLAARTSGQVVLGVGLHSGYGSAQRLYVKRGYVPDGSGCGTRMVLSVSMSLAITMITWCSTSPKSCRKESCGS